MKRTLVAVIVIIVLAVGGYAIFHNSGDNNSTQTSSSSSSSKSTTPDVNNAVLITKTDSKLGKYLADPSGKALYTYNADSKGVSNCTGSCLANWPAYVDSGSTTNLPAGVGTIKRTDNGQLQYTYNGQPLYYFASDGNNQVTGDGVENFKVARPAAPESTSSGQSDTSTPPQSSTSNNTNSGYPY